MDLYAPRVPVPFACMTSEHKRATGAAARGSALLITNATKLVGLGLAINEAAIRTNARDSVIALAAICVLGAQVVEDVLLKLIDRIFGQSRGLDGS